MTPGAQQTACTEVDAPAAAQFCYPAPAQLSCYSKSCSYSSVVTQSLRGIPTRPTTRCSCVLISSSTKQDQRPRKMRKSILSFARRLWSSEDTGRTGGGRRALCTNCKTDPVTLSTLCKKCCRRSTVCATCYSRILSLHHTRLDRFGSLGEDQIRPTACTECDVPDRISVTMATPRATIDDVPFKGPSVGTSQRSSKLTPEKLSSSSDSDYQSCSENVDLTNDNKISPKHSAKEKVPIIEPTVLFSTKGTSARVDCSRTEVTTATRGGVTPLTRAKTMDHVYRTSRAVNPNRPAMIRARAIDECDELEAVMVKRSSMSEHVAGKPADVLLPARLFDKLPDKENLAAHNPRPRKISTESNCHPPVQFTRSFSESSKDRHSSKKAEVQRPRHSSISDTRYARCHVTDTSYATPNNRSAVKRTVRIAEEDNQEYSRPSSLEVEHVTVGEVTPTVYIKDSQHIVDESFQKSESVLKRSLSVSNSRLQRKLSKKLAIKSCSGQDTADQQDTAPSFIRRNRSGSSVDKSSPPPDIDMLTGAGMKLEDIQAFGSIYVRRLESQMRNIDSLKAIEKQHNISCRERLKYALDTHDQLSVELEEVKKQLKDCMEKYRFASETFV